MTFKERRDTLADFLEFEVQPRLDGAKFDMGLWGATDTGAIPPRSNSFRRLSECGFAGCAAGWGAFCPALIKEGIPVRRGYSTVETTFGQLAEFFGLDDVYYVFDSTSYASVDTTIPEVVERLRAATDERKEQ